MKMTEEEYNGKTYDLPYNHPPQEDIWDIDSNSRRVYIPPQFRWITAVQGDHNSEILTFRIDRYFDGVDLSEKTCVIQFMNAGGICGTYQAQKFDVATEKDKLLFQWAVDNVATQYGGDLTFVVKFYSTGDDDLYDFMWNSLPTIVNVHAGLDITDEAEKLYPTILMEWMEVVVKCKYFIENADDVLNSFSVTAQKKLDELEGLYDQIRQALLGIDYESVAVIANSHENRLRLVEEYLFGEFTTNYHKMFFTYDSLINTSETNQVKRVKVTGYWNEALSRMEC